MCPMEICHQPSISKAILDLCLNTFIIKYLIVPLIETYTATVDYDNLRIEVFLSLNLCLYLKNDSIYILSICIDYLLIKYLYQKIKVVYLRMVGFTF